MQPLFIDTLNALASELQSNAMHILTHPKKTSEKIQAFTMQLVEFKCGLLSVIQSFILDQNVSSTNRWAQNEQIIQDVKAQWEKNQDKLQRYRLHQILKRKIDRQKRQSMLGSVLVGQNESMVQLERSMIMIEKDLGIQNQVDNLSERLGLSTVISRSLLGDTPLKREENRDESMMSEVSILPHDTSLVQIQKVEPPREIPKENLQSNLEVIKNEVQKQKEIKPKKVLPSTKKVKKTVYSKTDTTKEGLLGNLLSQTFQSCLQKK